MTSPQGESPLPDEEKAGELMAQMYIIKDVRTQTLQLEKVKMRVLENFQVMQSERDRIHDYKNELELLEQEKLAHVEELRQIHADMKAMKKVVQEANRYWDKTLNLAWDSFKEYTALKSEIDRQRQQLGLGEVPPISVGETLLDQEYFKEMRSRLVKEVAFETSVKVVDYTEGAPSIESTEGYQPEAGDLPSTSSVAGGSLRPRDPPMKTCQACQQSIHRNAPVCPLCKAKSKSRHSRRVKRKHEEDS